MDTITPPIKTEHSPDQHPTNDGLSKASCTTKTFNIPSPKSPSPKKDTLPKARRPVLNPGASPIAYRLARPLRVSDIFEEDEAASYADVEDGCQSPTLVMRRKKSLSTPSSSSSSSYIPISPPTLPPPIVATIQADIEESLLKLGKKRISRRQSGLINVTSSSSSVSICCLLCGVMKKES